MAARPFNVIRRLGLAVVLLPCAPLASGTGSAQETGGTYANPGSKGFADTFAYSSIGRAKDGYWYSRRTSGPPREGEKRTRVIPLVLAL